MNLREEIEKTNKEFGLYWSQNKGVTEIWKNEMDIACSSHERNEKYMHILGGNF